MVFGRNPVPFGIEGVDISFGIGQLLHGHDAILVDATATWIRVNGVCTNMRHERERSYGPTEGVLPFLTPTGSEAFTRMPQLSYFGGTRQTERCR